MKFPDSRQRASQLNAEWRTAPDDGAVLGTTIACLWPGQNTLADELMPRRRHRLLDYLFRPHGTELPAFAGQRSGSDCAEGLVQEAYLRLLQHPNPESIANLRAFLFQTTANLTVDHYRKQVLKSRYHRETGIEEGGEGELEQAPAGDPAPDVYWSRREELDRLNDMLQELPETTRYAFVLAASRGCPTAKSPSAWASPCAARNATSPRRSAISSSTKALAKVMRATIRGVALCGDDAGVVGVFGRVAKVSSLPGLAGCGSLRSPHPTY